MRAPQCHIEPYCVSSHIVHGLIPMNVRSAFADDAGHLHFEVISVFPIIVWLSGYKALTWSRGGRGGLQKKTPSAYASLTDVATLANAFTCFRFCQMILIID